MYDNLYEAEWLQLLRGLKYLQIYQPETFTELLKGFGPLMDEDVYEALETLLSCFFDSIGSDFDDSYELECIEVTSSVLDRFLSLGMALCSSRRNGNYFSYQEKLEDAVEFYLWAGTNCFCGYEVQFCSAAVGIKLFLSPDCYEPAAFVGQVVALLLYIRSETRHLESLLMKGSAVPDPDLPIGLEEN